MERAAGSQTGRQPTPFGKWLLEQMEKRGMSRSELARRIGTSRTTITPWIYDYLPSAPMCYDIARALDISIADVVIATRLNDDA